MKLLISVTPSRAPVCLKGWNGVGPEGYANDLPEDLGMIFESEIGFRDGT